MLTALKRSTQTGREYEFTVAVVSCSNRRNGKEPCACKKQATNKKDRSKRERILVMILDLCKSISCGLESCVVCTNPS